MTNLLPASPAILDLRGYRCPIPVIKLERWLREAEDGAQVVVFSDDPIAKVDIPMPALRPVMRPSRHRQNPVSAAFGSRKLTIPIKAHKTAGFANHSING